jgi:hypothetical protein
VGDTLPVRTGIILDYNGNPVPDNTPVDFIFAVNGTEAPAITAGTIDGIAAVSTLVEEAGIIEIRAVAGLAQSAQITLDVPEERPSPTPSASVTPTETATLEPSPTIENPTPTPVADSQSQPDIIRLVEWIIALAICLLTGWSALRVGAATGQVRWGVRWGLAALIGGLLAYTYVALQLPGAELFLETPYHSGLLLITFAGALLGWGIALIVRASGNRK